MKINYRKGADGTRINVSCIWYTEHVSRHLKIENVLSLQIYVKNQLHAEKDFFFFFTE